MLTGAGTSAFAGSSIAHFLKNKTNIRFEAISTTDLVSNPRLYFEKTVPTLLVSFARSGNSPESVEATKLAEQLVDDCYHLAVTCNKEGQLYNASLACDNYFAMLMPEESNDIGFAMTSSFTLMMIL
nr:SIS domain-containing protein [Psychromonas hadalis]